MNLNNSLIEIQVWIARTKKANPNAKTVKDQGRPEVALVVVKLQSVKTIEVIVLKTITVVQATVTKVVTNKGGISLIRERVMLNHLVFPWAKTTALASAKGLIISHYHLLKPLPILLLPRE
jgi:hypothetical protein